MVVGAAKGAVIIGGKVLLEESAAGGERGLWQLTEGGADKILRSNRFGKFYRSSSDGLWWSADQAGHGGSAFKVFTESQQGLNWFSDADQFGDFIVGKYKGPTGRFIPWGSLH